MNVDGKGLRRLSRGRDSSPTWSPDSQTIAFGRVLRGVSSVHLMRADGTGHRHLVRRASGPAWSPDGSTIAFIRGDSLWLMDSDGGNQRRAIGVPRSGVESVGWSPDSRHLAFEYYGSAAARGLHIIGVDGTKPRHVLWAADPPSGYDWGPNPAS